MNNLCNYLCILNCVFLLDEINKLRTWRENNVRDSKEVIDAWCNITSVIGNNVDKLGKESNCVNKLFKMILMIVFTEYLILEQVCIAALDCFRNDIAHNCIKQLLFAFPKSLRVRKYEAMRLEANENYEDALRILDGIIKEDDTNSAARKRKVAIFKAQAKNVEAIKELTDYLKM